MNYNLDPNMFTDISNRAISNKPISWNWIERICSTFEDILEVINHCISVGATLNGIPSERVEKYLKEKNVNLRSLQ